MPPPIGEAVDGPSHFAGTAIPMPAYQYSTAMDEDGNPYVNGDVNYNIMSGGANLADPSMILSSKQTRRRFLLFLASLAPALSSSVNWGV